MTVDQYEALCLYANSREPWAEPWPDGWDRRWETLPPHVQHLAAGLFWVHYHRPLA